jgi:hypothetical protein
MRIILIAKAACNEWEIYGDDVSQDFLYARRPADKPLYAAYPIGHQKHSHCVLYSIASSMDNMTVRLHFTS